MCFCLQFLSKRRKTECPVGLGGSRLGTQLAACWSIWSAAAEARARRWGAGMEGEKLRGLEEQAGARMAGSGAGGSRRAVTPAEGWGGGFASARKDLLVWTEPHSVGQCWGTWRVSCVGTCVQVSPGFEKEMGSLWRAAVAVELEGRAPPSSNYPAISPAHEVLHTRKINRCC